MSTDAVAGLHGGMQASFSKLITAQEAADFASLVGEPHPFMDAVHWEEEAQPVRFQVPHHYLVGIIGGQLSSRLPGGGSQCVTVQYEFLAPIFSGDRIDTLIELAEYDPGKHLATFRMDCFNQGKNQVLTGQAVMLVPA